MSIRSLACRMYITIRCLRTRSLKSWKNLARIGPAGKALELRWGRRPQAGIYASFMFPIRKATRGVSQTQNKEAAMSPDKFPAGWDEQKVRRVLSYYEAQTEDEACVESSETVMNVPHDLVSKVRELIAKRHS